MYMYIEYLSYGTGVKCKICGNLSNFLYLAPGYLKGTLWGCLGKSFQPIGVVLCCGFVEETVQMCQGIYNRRMTIGVK